LRWTTNDSARPRWIGRSADDVTKNAAPPPNITIELGELNPPHRGMSATLQLVLIASAALFSIGLLAALSRRHAIFILIGIEMMLAAANINFIAFWRFNPQPQQPTGVMVAIFAISIAAAEAAVGLAMVIAVYRHYGTTNVDELTRLKG
jgi:NADH:ubiquinone oxidoreductase subunit K